MKALLASLALALMFAAGSVYAGSGSSYDGESGCSHSQKWEDT